MLDFLHRSLLLHLLLNTAYVGLGIVAGLLLAWRLRWERRFVVRAPYLLKLLLVAVVVAGLLTFLGGETFHFVVAVVLGLLAGLGAAYLARAQAKPNDGGEEDPSPRGR